MDQNSGFILDGVYIKIFPRASFSYAPTKHSNFSFNYSKRLVRPPFWALNPNVTYLTPFETMQGNPFLKPAFVDNIELINTHKKWTTKAYYSYEKNLFEEVIIPNEDTNDISATYENYIDKRVFGFSEHYVFDKMTWWTSYTSVNLYYIDAEFDLPQIGNKEKLSARISSYTPSSIKPEF